MQQNTGTQHSCSSSTVRSSQYLQTPVVLPVQEPELVLQSIHLDLQAGAVLLLVVEVLDSTSHALLQAVRRACIHILHDTSISICVRSRQKFGSRQRITQQHGPVHQAGEI